MGICQIVLLFGNLNSIKLNFTYYLLLQRRSFHEGNYFDKFPQIHFEKGLPKGLDGINGMTKINVKAKAGDKKQLKKTVFTPGMVLNFDTFVSI